LNFKIVYFVYEIELTDISDLKIWNIYI